MESSFVVPLYSVLLGVIDRKDLWKLLKMVKPRTISVKDLPEMKELLLISPITASSAQHTILYSLQVKVSVRNTNRIHTVLYSMYSVMVYSTVQPVRSHSDLKDGST